MDRVITLPLLLALAVSCAPTDSAEQTAGDTAAGQEAGAVDEDAVAREIRDEVDRHTERWTNMEPEPYLELYPEDVTWMFDGAALDRAAFADLVREYMAGVAESELTWSDTSVQVLGPDAAVFSGTWSAVDTDAEGAETPSEGALTLVYERRDGQWTVIHAHESLVDPGAEGS